MLLQRVFNGDEVLQRLGHLAAGDGQVARVQEVPDPAVVFKVGLSGQGGSGGQGAAAGRTEGAGRFLGA